MLTLAQRTALELIDSFTDIATSNVTSADVPSVSMAVAGRLEVAGLITLSNWNGTAFACRLTDAGRAVLEAAS